MKIKIISERRSAILTLSLWETPEVTTAAKRWVSQLMSRLIHRFVRIAARTVAQLRRLPQG
jgi:hypothetical protein